MRPLSLEWTKGLEGKRKEQFELALRNSSTALSRLLDMTEEWEEELTRQECNVRDYDTPNWEVRQAHRNGDRSRIRKLRDLLSFLKG